MSELTQFELLGMSIGCKQFGLNTDDIPVITGMAKSASSNNDAFVRASAECIATMLDNFRGQGTAPANHFHLIAKSASLPQECKDEVYDTLVWIHNKIHADGMAKVAGVLEPIKAVVGKGAQLLGGGTEAGTSLAQTAAMVALLGGGAVGAGHWLLNKELNRDSEDNEMLQARIDYYNHMTQQLEDKKRKQHGYDESRFAEPSLTA